MAKMSEQEKYFNNHTAKLNKDADNRKVMDTNW